jgi:hypothetical protein
MKKLTPSQRYARDVLKKAKAHNWYYKKPQKKIAKKKKPA